MTEAGEEKKYFEFEAMNAEGKRIQGTVCSRNMREAKSLVEKNGLVLTKMHEQIDRSFFDFLYRKVDEFFNRVRLRDLKVFTRKFSTMINSGVTVSRALQVLAISTSNRILSRALKGIAEGITEGKNLHEAMSAYPTVFDSTYVFMVQAGEVSGTLSNSLDFLAQNIEKKEELRRKVIGAMVYPAIAMAFAVVVVGVMMIYVVPSFQELFASSGRELPFLTQSVIAISELCQTYIGVVLWGFLLLYLAYRVAMTTEAGTRLADRVLLATPIFGKIHRISETIQFCRTSSNMISAGVTLADSLRCSQQIVKNSVISDAIERSVDMIIHGNSLANAFAETDVFPPLVGEMIFVGEDSGTLDLMLLKVSEFYEDDLDMAVSTLTKLIEPMMTVGVGGVIAFILIAMYLPVFKLADIF